jgi:hypothetical protein
MAVLPVKPGTTDAQFEALLQSGSPPLLGGPKVGNDLVSPGKSILVSYNLPPGTYVLLELPFVADPTTGVPHAFMGMHKIVILT